MNHYEKFESYIPFDLLTGTHFLQAFIVILLMINFRYFLAVGLFWFIYYKKSLRKSAIYKELPGRTEQLFEIKWSINSSIVFSLVAVAWGVLWQLGWTRIYLPFEQFGWFYWPASYLLLALLHETYFYWTHRALHQPALYKLVHSVHHASLKPSPWASFSFHPVESLINAAALPLISLVLPLHPVLILIHLSVMTLTAITNHLGFEILPHNMFGLKLGRHIVSGVHHGQHHRFFSTNFGLFFTWWDKICKTENKNFEKHFMTVTRGQSVW